MNGKSWIQPLQQSLQEEAKPLIVPGKGKAVRVYPWNRTLLRNTLVLHEGKQAEIRNDTLYIEGRPSQHCYFTKDYYWMASNNSVNLSDSPPVRFRTAGSCHWKSFTNLVLKNRPYGNL